MKKKFRSFWGSIALAALVMLTLSACDNPTGSSPGNGNNQSTDNDGIMLPVSLRNTRWVRDGGYRISFGTNTVTMIQNHWIVGAGMHQQEFTLQNILIVNEPGLTQYNLIFAHDPLTNFITYRDGAITSVSLDVNRTGGWNQHHSAIISDINSRLAQHGGGNSRNNPIPLALSHQLTEMNWIDIVDALHTARRYVALDLSASTRSTANTGGGLRSDGTFSQIPGLFASRVVSLILPNAATRISEMIGFNNLVSVRGAAITEIGQAVFQNLRSLTSVDFPAATVIGAFVFAGCSNLTHVNLPNVNNIGSGVFSMSDAIHNMPIVELNLTIILGNTAPTLAAQVLSSSTFSNPSSFKNITIKIPAGATGYTEDWRNRFRGTFPNITVEIVTQ